MLNYKAILGVILIQKILIRRRLREGMAIRQKFGLINILLLDQS